MPFSCNGRLSLWKLDRKSTRLNSSHTVIYTLSLHDALPISAANRVISLAVEQVFTVKCAHRHAVFMQWQIVAVEVRSEEHTSELQSHSDLHSFPTRRSSDLRRQ